MSAAHDVDVIVGGGGVAGVAAAAAIRQLGYRVMVVEPRQKDDRRLAGEVFHPPGVSGLAELGLLTALDSEPAVNVRGFSVHCEGEFIPLRYEAVSSHRRPGLCLEHAHIRERMLNAVGTLPGITVKRGTRVVGINQIDPSHVVVELAVGGGTMRYSCGLLIVADGSPSRLASMAGITVHNRRISTIWGYRISTRNLPSREFGHVFLDGATPVLLYPISRSEARILFDIPYQPSVHTKVADCLSLTTALPPALREEVAGAIKTQRRMSILAQATTPERSACGRVVLVGDAGGSCHPLTATGMTMCVGDALLLRDALCERAGNVPAALKLYERRRRWPQATRLTLADALRNTMCGESPELRVLRSGMLAYWRGSPAGRSATLALLSTADSRPLAFLRQMVTVMLRGFASHLRHPLPANRGIGRVRIACALLVNLVHHGRQILVWPHPLPFAARR
jgi:2-polyprenyl-6-methoxyphenol hydroxylase-like FAD-dependent oxidoreductase